MNIQIFGQKKCSNTRKAERFFSERNIPYHLVDLASKGISEGELQSICRKINAADLIDPDSQVYKKKGFAYMTYDPVEEILENPTLLKSPVIRNGSEVSCGYVPEVWKEWIQQV